MSLGLPELIVIFAVALLVFGPKRLPELAKNMGKGIRDFKRALSGEEETKFPPTAESKPADPAQASTPPRPEGTEPKV